MLPTNSLYLALGEALDGSMWVLPLWDRVALKLFSQTSEMSLCDLGYYSAQSVPLLAEQSTSTDSVQSHRDLVAMTNKAN